MINFSRREKIAVFVEEETNKVLRDSTNSLDKVQMDTNYIAEKLNLTRSNVSKELNSLFREKKVIKILGKPVLYIASEPFQYILDVNNSKMTEYAFSQEEFLQLLEERENSPEKSDIFSTMVGSKGSLRTIVDQLKSAILYPPNGLHILLSGSTGVGKTTMVDYLYRYALEEGTISNSGKLVSFNCSDYADNPQLLMSILFGYEKGAFTGADTSKDGLIKRAENGILFLDEVHRLPPQAQEMLFQVIDNNRYRKLGQIEENILNNILFIMATTEDISSYLLKTFTRRIPVAVTLPDLSMRYPSERMEYIFMFLYEESKRIHIPLVVEKETLEALLLYTVEGNLGQLKVDIKLTCAKAFMRKGKNRMQPLLLEFSDLPETVIKSYFEENKNKDSLVQDILTRLDQLTEIDFRKKENTQTERTTLAIDTFSSVNTQFPLNQSNFQTNQETKKVLLADPNTAIEQFYNQIDFAENTEHLESVAKIIDHSIFLTVKTMLAELSLPLEKSTVIGLMLHINTLREKFFSGSFSKHSKNKDLAVQYPEEYDSAIKMRRILNQKLDFYIPEGELNFFTLFLHLANKNEEKKVGIIALSHGENIATSMCKLVNSFLNTDYAIGIDVPLEESVEAVLDQTIDLVQKIDKGRGVLILSDMGSLSQFAGLVKDRTGIDTRNISPISTPLLLEATSKIINTNIDLETLYNSLDSELSNSMNSGEAVPMDYRLIEYLQQVLLFLDPKKTVNLLDKVFSQILLGADIIGDNGLWIKFIFHCSSMIERIMMGDALPYNAIETLKQTHNELFTIIKKEFYTIEESFFITLPDTELAYVLEIFDTH
ncbi:sigma 54-interacting transcriptional regulator [Enterococcus hulanensis]|uniref:sigma 54-interacting transcriptional regulator n=1 Tax=Enterococcus hulanensis TaxID=2559929 RepID=UPI001A8EAAA7|nr:sigma 54-interacting transcriptional regulator [Enterococcus hulanensis]MBO0458450.1 sigma 54-interacting transcriptional regulator [Enterococcus hulanensis]